jgi:UDPglucose 6-dehydrogenase
VDIFKKPKIGIVGLGFVGSAIRDNMEDNCELILVDTDPSRGQHTYKHLLDCEGIFITVPSPQGTDGKCDTSILEGVLKKLKDYKGVIISKCTAPPSTYDELGKQYSNLVHAPEFLTAANASKDYANGKFAIIGGTVVAYQREAERIIRLGQHGLGSNVQFCSLGEASLAKYAINCFMSTKVIFMNELENLANVSGLSYNKIASMITMDERIGKSHMKVPGPDGYYGFGGMCFPKDTSAILKYAEEQGTEMAVLKAAVKKNTLLRLTEPK